MKQNVQLRCRGFHVPSKSFFFLVKPIFLPNPTRDCAEVHILKNIPPHSTNKVSNERSSVQLLILRMNNSHFFSQKNA